jgi:hypothetical protein
VCFQEYQKVGAQTRIVQDFAADSDLSSFENAAASTCMCVVLSGLGVLPSAPRVQLHSGFSHYAPPQSLSTPFTRAPPTPPPPTPHYLPLSPLPPPLRSHHTAHTPLLPPLFPPSTPWPLSASCTHPLHRPPASTAGLWRERSVLHLQRWALEV